MGRGLRIGYPTGTQYSLAAAQGSIALTGQATALTYSGEGPTYYAALASDGGSASNPGTLEQPWTLKYALTQLVAGDTLRVLGSGPFIDDEDYSANWREAFNTANSGTESAPIIIRSHVPRQAVIQGRIVGTDHCPAVGILRRSYVRWHDFTVIGCLKNRGEKNDGPYGVGSGFVGCDVSEGDREGDDNSLNWGIACLMTTSPIVSNCRVRDMVNRGNTSNNTGCIDLFDTTDAIVEYNDVDATNVFSGIGFKAGNCHRNIIRYNIVRNARSGNGGESGAGFLLKADTLATKFCDDNVYYGNITINCFSDFILEYNIRRTIAYNNTHYGSSYCFDHAYTSVIDSQFYNNIYYGGGTPRRPLQIDTLSGASPDWSPYIINSDYNNYFNHANFAFWADGASSMTLATWQSTQTGITGHDANSITSDPEFVNAAAEDFTLDTGSPALTAGPGDTQIGAYGVTSLVGCDWT